MAKRKPFTIKIAPKLANGDSRVKTWDRLPEPIKEGLRAIARDEKQSISWVKEQALIDYFRLKMPRYKENRDVRPSKRK